MALCQRDLTMDMPHLERIYLIATVSVSFSIMYLSAILQKQEIKMNKLARVLRHYSVQLSSDLYRP